MKRVQSRVHELEIAFVKNNLLYVADSQNVGSVIEGLFHRLLIDLSSLQW